MQFKSFNIVFRHLVSSLLACFGKYKKTLTISNKLFFFSLVILVKESSFKAFKEKMLNLKVK